jgi:endoglucanase
MNLDFLLEILSQPTAPFREGHVMDTFLRALARERVPHFQDPVGNIVVGVPSRQAYLALLRRRSPEPVRVFLAHMDHPGFHGQRWLSDRELEVQWFGGSPPEHLDGAPVWLASREGWAAEGFLSQPEMDAKTGRLAKAVVKVANKSQHELAGPKALYGAFRFRAPVWQADELLYTKAADDLVGSWVVAMLGIQHRARNSHFIGVLTRAEEVGFVGAIGHFELGWLQRARRPVVVVSLETSRTLPGAEMGKGPVVRLGDRATTFDPGALQVLSDLAKKVLPKHQRRIMDGGTCEATVAVAYGFPAIGISIPLGNYHNQSYEGGPDSRGPMGPAPEFVHIDDIAGMQKLCQGLLKTGLGWKTPWAGKIKEFRQRRRKFTRLLAEV